MNKVSSKNTTELTEQEKQAIDDYGKKIITLKDFVTAVRKMPGMYCGGEGNRGFLSLIREVFQNGIDQIIDTNSPANVINISYNEITHEVICIDNGMGFPFDDMIRMITEPHTSKNYEKKKGEYSSGLHGVGLKVTNALASVLHVESYRYDGEARAADFEEGYLVKGPYKIPNKNKLQGSIVKFIPSTDVLGEITLEWKIVYHLIKDILSLTPIGSEVIFTAMDIAGQEHKEKMINTDGIITRLISDVKFPLNKPIIISEDNGEMKLDLAFMYDCGGQQGPDPDASITAFCNMCPTTLGTHIDGVLDGITKWFMSYMNNIYLSNQKSKDKTKVTSADIKCGLNIMISAACLEPVLVGQAKEQLSNPEMVIYCKDVVSRGLENWSKSNPQDLAKLSKYFKDMADVRTKAEGAKAKIVTKYQANSLTGLPAKYAKPTERCDELILVEGDSAGGSAKVGRDVTCQGIFPLRGKIPSAFEKTKAEFWGNAEIQGIARIILNKDYTRNFDAEKDVVWKKIIFMADADVDGAHISSLLLRYFILYMPQLIEAGKVYKALPPLYSFQNGKKTHFLTNQLDFVRYVQKDFMQKNEIKDSNKVIMSNKELTNLFMVNEDYVYEVERLSTTYAVDPKLLELALFANYNALTYNQTKKELRSEFRFMDVEQTKNSLYYKGTIKDVNFLFINDRLINDCQRLLSIIKKNSSLYFILNNNKCTLYDIMKAFDTSKPSGIKRYKGLGEMNDDQIAVSTLRPDADRMLIRYTLQDAKEELETIREYESDRSKLLDLVGTVKRTDLLD